MSWQMSWRDVDNGLRMKASQNMASHQQQNLLNDHTRDEQSFYSSVLITESLPRQWSDLSTGTELLFMN